MTPRRGRKPPTWKEALLTWAGIFPLVLASQYWLAPMLDGLPVLAVVALSSMILTVAMCYVVMPVLEYAFARWLAETDG